MADLSTGIPSENYPDQKQVKEFRQKKKLEKKGGHRELGLIGKGTYIGKGFKIYNYC